MRKILVAAMLVGCGGASAKLQMSNNTSVARTDGTENVLGDGTSLRLKIISVSLAPDVDPVTMDNIGESVNIWLNPQCGGDDSSCNIDGFTPPAGPRITDYFDLSRSNDEINADLNSQDAPITPGTYRYARLELCKALGGQAQPTVPGLMWKGPDMTAEQPFTSGDCGRTSLGVRPTARPRHGRLGRGHARLRSE